MNFRQGLGLLGLVGAILCVFSVSVNLSVGNYGMAFLMVVCLGLNLNNFYRNYLGK